MNPRETYSESPAVRLIARAADAHRAEVTALLGAIKDAFLEADPPTMHQIQGDDPMDHERQENWKHLAGRPWSEVPARSLGKVNWWLLSGRSFSYYLPGLMVEALRDPLSMNLLFDTGAFDPGRLSVEDEAFLAYRMNAMDKEQLKATAAFVAYACDLEVPSADYAWKLIWRFALDEDC